MQRRFTDHIFTIGGHRVLIDAFAGLCHDWRAPLSIAQSRDKIAPQTQGLPRPWGG